MVDRLHSCYRARCLSLSRWCLWRITFDRIVYNLQLAILSHSAWVPDHSSHPFTSMPYLSGVWYSTQLSLNIIWQLSKIQSIDASCSQIIIATDAFTCTSFWGHAKTCASSSDRQTQTDLTSACQTIHLRSTHLRSISQDISDLSQNLITTYSRYISIIIQLTLEESLARAGKCLIRGQQVETINPIATSNTNSSDQSILKSADPTLLGIPPEIRRMILEYLLYSN